MGTSVRQRGEILEVVLHSRAAILDLPTELLQQVVMLALLFSDGCEVDLDLCQINLRIRYGCVGTLRDVLARPRLGPACGPPALHDQAIRLQVPRPGPIILYRG